MAAAVVMLAVGVSFLYVLLGKRPGYRPADAMEWIGALLSVALVASAALLLVLAFRQAGTPSAASAVLVAPGASRPEIQDLTMDTPAEPFPFRRVDDGVRSSLDSLKGKVVLANFWATWCGPCLTEIPELNRLQQKYADRGLVVLSISDEDPATLTAFDESFGLETLSVQVPPGQRLPAPFTTAFEVRPTSFVIDREGRVRRFVLGARSYENFERMIAPHL